MGRLQGEEQLACNIPEIKKKKKKERKRGRGEGGGEGKGGGEGEEEKYPRQDGVNLHTAILANTLLHT